MNTDQIARFPRLLMEARLKPLQGHRFQPTGFPDLGPARYTLPDGTEMLLVESAQSMANRLEAVCWDNSVDDLIPELHGLPYVRVVREDGTHLTNSILEAHRINSEYIRDSGFLDRFASEIACDKKQPVDWKRLHTALLKYDIGSLLHGCFLEEIDGRLRVTRALTGFIEARGIREAESGGVKNNRVEAAQRGGEGNVPYHRTEFTAESITVYFNLDLALLRGYGLDVAATRLLIALALFKIRRFLRVGLRLRTACDLEVDGDLVVTRPRDVVVPSEEDALDECKRLIAQCKPLFADPPVTIVKWNPEKQKDKSKKKGGQGAQDGDNAS